MVGLAEKSSRHSEFDTSGDVRQKVGTQLNSEGVERPMVASSFHFQLYSAAQTTAVRWRLLSGNNRDMGRGVLVYRDPEHCRAGIREVLRRLDELEPSFVPEVGNTWRWFLRYKGEPVVTSGHPYDRKVRCNEGHIQFLRHAPGAVLREDAAVLSVGRRASGGVIDLRDRVADSIPGQRGRDETMTRRVLG
jgi:hypothetical protein